MKKHTVRGTAKNFELAHVGHAINLSVYRGKRLRGRLNIGQGGIHWTRSGRGAAPGQRIPWEVFETIMKEWPFGHSKRAEGEAPPQKDDRPKPVEVPALRHVMKEVRIVSYKAKNGDELWFNNPGSGKKVSTPIIVHMDGVDLGTIDTEDRYWPASRDEPLTWRVTGYMQQFLADPEYWIKKFGQRTGYCAVCGHKMWQQESLNRGIGPKCARRLGYLGSRLAA